MIRMKESELRKISNPERVFKKFKKLGLGGTIHISNLKDKKYYVMTPEGRKVQFGSRMEDYTYHRDKQRRDNFKSRNRKWKTAYKYSPAYLSYHLLW